MLNTDDKAYVSGVVFLWAQMKMNVENMMEN